MELAHPPLAETSRPLTAVTLIRALVVSLVACSVWLPFIPIAGPLSIDDLFPLIAVVVALATLAFSRAQISFDSTFAGFALLALLGVISSAANAETLNDFVRLAGRSSGRFIFFFTLIVSLRALLTSRSWPRIAIAVMIVVSTIECAFGLWAFATKYMGPYGLGVVNFPDWSVLKGGVRIQGTFSGSMTEFEVDAVSANFLAAYLVMTIPVSFAYALWSNRMRTQLISLGATAMQLAVLYLTYTRAALVALGAPILVMGFLYGRRKLAVGALILGVMLTLAIPSVRTKFLSEDHNRYALWYASLSITADHPVAGIGDGNYDRVLHESHHYHANRFGTAATASHNSILLSAAHLGWAGAVAHLILYGALVMFALQSVNAIRGRDRILAVGIAGALAAYLVQDQFNNLAYVPKVATQSWFLFALLAALRDRTLERDDEVKTNG
jgi:hypothetical protein